MIVTIKQPHICLVHPINSGFYSVLVTFKNKHYFPLSVFCFVYHIQFEKRLICILSILFVIICFSIHYICFVHCLTTRTYHFIKFTFFVLFHGMKFISSKISWHTVLSMKIIYNTILSRQEFQMHSSHQTCLQLDVEKVQIAKNFLIYNTLF